MNIPPNQPPPCVLPLIEKISLELVGGDKDSYEEMEILVKDVIHILYEMGYAVHAQGDAPE